MPDSYDEVVLESNYDWHTEDRRYGIGNRNVPDGTANGQAHVETNGVDVKPETTPAPSGDEPNGTRSSSPDLKGKRKAIELLSSDDEGSPTRTLPNGNTLAPPRVPLRPTPASSAPLSAPPSTRPSVGPSSSRTSAQPNAIIDLTLSDSEDEGESRPPSDPAPTRDRSAGSDNGTDPYFRQPGAGSTSRAAADSLSPLPRHDYPGVPTLSVAREDPASRPQHSAWSGWRERWTAPNVTDSPVASNDQTLSRPVHPLPPRPVLSPMSASYPPVRPFNQNGATTPLSEPTPAQRLINLSQQYDPDRPWGKQYDPNYLGQFAWERPPGMEPRAQRPRASDFMDDGPRA